jgi:hypothetical protein
MRYPVTVEIMGSNPISVANMVLSYNGITSRLHRDQGGSIPSRTTIQCPVSIKVMRTADYCVKAAQYRHRVPVYVPQVLR